MISCTHVLVQSTTSIGLEVNNNNIIYLFHTVRPKRPIVDRYMIQIFETIIYNFDKE